MASAFLSALQKMAVQRVTCGTPRRMSPWLRAATACVFGLLLVAAAPVVRAEAEDSDPGHVLQLTEATFDATVQAEKLMVCHARKIRPHTSASGCRQRAQGVYSFHWCAVGPWP